MSTHWKDSDAGQDWRQEEKGTTEEEMVGWPHWLNGHEFEQAPGIGEGQEAWRTAVHVVTKSWTQLSDWTILNWIDNSQVINLLTVQDSNILRLVFQLYAWNPVMSHVDGVTPHEGQDKLAGQERMTWTWFTVSPKATEFTFELYANSVILTKDSRVCVI